jgi:hypothetical protein
MLVAGDAILKVAIYNEMQLVSNENSPSQTIKGKLMS